MNSIEVFKTSVCQAREAVMIIQEISKCQPAYSISFDLQDCDHVLRIESRDEQVNVDLITALLNKHNYECEVLIN